MNGHIIPFMFLPDPLIKSILVEECCLTCVQQTGQIDEVVLTLLKNLLTHLKHYV